MSRIADRLAGLRPPTAAQAMVAAWQALQGHVALAGGHAADACRHWQRSLENDEPLLRCLSPRLAAPPRPSTAEPVTTS